VIKILNEDVSLAHSAIPYLPLPLAILCCALNTLLPGLGETQSDRLVSTLSNECAGTVASGLAACCVGQPRMTQTEGRRCSSCLLNLLVGLAQAGTITFFLVGWFWSIAWGGMMIVHAG